MTGSERRDAMERSEQQIISAALNCPACGAVHIDEGAWESRPHRTHLCLLCGNEWQVTVRGVPPQPARQAPAGRWHKRQLPSGDWVVGLEDPDRPGRTSHLIRVADETAADAACLYLNDLESALDRERRQREQAEARVTELEAALREKADELAANVAALKRELVALDEGE